MSPFRNDSAAQALLQTLQWFDTFQHPVTLTEWYASTPFHALTWSQCKESVAFLCKERAVVYHRGWYALPHRGGVVRVRPLRRKRASLVLRRAQRWFRILGMMPWMSASFITGSLAQRNASEHADIDVFCMTKPQRLWIARALSVSVLWWGRRYRTSHHSASRFCTNLWISEGDSSFHPSLYTAFELRHMVVYKSTPHVLMSLRSSNAWYCSLFPNIRVPVSYPVSIKHTYFLTNHVMALMNMVLFYYQCVRARFSSVRVSFSLNTAAFHPSPMRAVFSAKFLVRGS